jgi:hypothetical protein
LRRMLAKALHRLPCRKSGADRKKVQFGIVFPVVRSSA